jgi:hypothetical protein
VAVLLICIMRLISAAKVIKDSTTKNLIGAGRKACPFDLSLSPLGGARDAHQLPADFYGE